MLSYACAFAQNKNSIEIVKLLLSYDADPNYRNSKSDTTAMHFAVKYMFHESRHSVLLSIIKLLSENNNINTFNWQSNINYKYKMGIAKGKSLWLYICLYCNVESIDYIYNKCVNTIDTNNDVDNGTYTQCCIDLLATDNDGFNALYYSGFNKTTSLLLTKYLLENIYFPNNDINNQIGLKAINKRNDTSYDSCDQSKILTTNIVDCFCGNDEIPDNNDLIELLKLYHKYNANLFSNNISNDFSNGKGNMWVAACLSNKINLIKFMGDNGFVPMSNNANNQNNFITIENICFLICTYCQHSISINNDLILYLCQLVGNHSKYNSKNHFLELLFKIHSNEYGFRAFKLILSCILKLDNINTFDKWRKSTIITRRFWLRILVNNCNNQVNVNLYKFVLQLLYPKRKYHQVYTYIHIYCMCVYIYVLLVIVLYMYN